MSISCMCMLNLSPSAQQVGQPIEIIAPCFGSATRLLMGGRTATAHCAMRTLSSPSLHGNTQRWVRLASA